MVWNLLSVSPRVIGLALFASYQLYWFWGLVIAQVITAFILIIVVRYPKDGFDDAMDFLGTLLSCFFNSLGLIFTMISIESVAFPVYLLYWVVMLIENTVMISLWHQWSDELGFWYHNLALLYVIIAYVVSLIIKSVHSYFYEPNKSEKNIFKWKFFWDEDEEE